MNPPPLPLIDGCMFMDNSSWLTPMSICHRLLEYSQLHRRVGKGEKVGANFGSAFHLAMEHRYRNYGSKEVDQLYYQSTQTMLTQFFADHPVPENDWRGLNWAMEVIRQYNDRYPNEEFNLLTDKDGKPMVEVPFVAKIMDWSGELPKQPGPILQQLIGYTDPNIARYTIPIYYCGRVDLPIFYDGKIFILDFKTTSMMSTAFFDAKRMSSQQKGYCWGFKQATGTTPEGYIVRAIRTKEPPQYVLNGEMSRRGTKQSPEQWWSESFQEERYYLNDDALDEWQQNTIEKIEEFFYHYQRGYLPMTTQEENCTRFNGKCQFYEVCRLQTKDREQMLKSNMFTENEWNPLRDPKKVE